MDNRESLNISNTGLVALFCKGSVDIIFNMIQQIEGSSNFGEIYEKVLIKVQVPGTDINNFLFIK
jgi:hypothetical protein